MKTGRSDCSRYEALIAAEDAGSAPLKSLERRSWILKCLREHAKGLAILPGRAAFELAEALADLDTGREHPLLSRKKKASRRYSARQLSQIADAIRYLCVVERGVVDDPVARKTVAKAYGVSVPQVAYWRRTLSPVASRRDADADSSTLVVLAMKKSGERFSARLVDDSPTGKSSGRPLRS